jgi:hypothetical protein
MPVREEQTAWKQPKTLRASRPQPAQAPQGTGHQTGLHPEDTPRHTTQDQSRKPVRMAYTNDDDEAYTQARMPTVIKRYNRLPVPTQTRVKEEMPVATVTPLRFFLIALGVFLTALALALVLIAYAIPALNRWNDDRVYGFPRTTHARAMVGHGTTAQPYSDFTGENIDGYVYVFEVEETDPSQKHPQTYFITRYTGQNKDRLAVTDITFTDENGDGKVDMLVTMENGSTFVLYNNGSGFSVNPPK